MEKPKRRKGSNKGNELLKYIAMIIASIVSALLLYLGYYTEIRSYILLHHGLYVMGFVDAILVATTLFAATLYLCYLLTKAFVRSG